VNVVANETKQRKANCGPGNFDLNLREKKVMCNVSKNKSIDFLFTGNFDSNF
jgi:hypothetical protein